MATYSASNISGLKQFFSSQIESGPNTTYPAYRSPLNKTAYIKKISITNNSSLSGTFDIGLYENNIITGGNLFVVLSDSTTTTALTSTDGINWDSRNLIYNTPWQSITYGNGRYVAVSTNNTSAAAYSTNGITWSAATLPASGNWQTIAYGNGRFVVTAYGSLLAISTNGITWTQSTMPTNNGSYTLPAFGYGNDIFLATSNGNSYSYSSTDGITWTTRTAPSNQIGAGGKFQNGRFIFFNTNGSNNLIYLTTDGVKWNTGTLPTSTLWNDVAYGNGTYVVTSRNLTTAAATSTDGINWTLRTMPNITYNYYGSVSFGNGIFVAVSRNSAYAASSTDGITWTSRTLPSSSNWNRIAYPLKSDFSNDSYLYKGVTLAADTTSIINYEVVVPPTHELRVRSTVPMQVTINGEV